jgi:hypothetical protein
MIVLANTGIPLVRVITPNVCEPIELVGIRVTPFEGLHGEVPAMGYLVEYQQKRWLFPGDVRRYDISWQPVIGLVDALNQLVDRSSPSWVTPQVAV